RIDFPRLTGGRRITVYGQQEVVKDLIAAPLDTGRPLLFEVEGAGGHAPGPPGGRRSTVYGQQEVVKDLIAARLDTGRPLLFEVEGVGVHDLESEVPLIRFRDQSEDVGLGCDFIAGCDGFHGVSRDSIPAGVLTPFERVYPFAWLGILAAAPPSNDELIYAYSERGFALHSMRSPTITRMYLQVRPDDDLAEWPDPAVWEAREE